jgi:hypothetical protein
MGCCAPHQAGNTSRQSVRELTALEDWQGNLSVFFISEQPVLDRDNALQHLEQHLSW